MNLWRSSLGTPEGMSDDAQLSLSAVIGCKPLTVYRKEFAERLAEELEKMIGCADGQCKTCVQSNAESPSSHVTIGCNEQKLISDIDHAVLADAAEMDPW